METIRDRQGHILGYIDDKSLSNAIVARNRQGNVVAIFDIAANKTRLPNGHAIASGNVIAAFLIPER
jgi:hypothetical protein